MSLLLILLTSAWSLEGQAAREINAAGAAAAGIAPPHFEIDVLREGAVESCLCAAAATSHLA